MPQMMLPQQHELMQQSLCEKHFPEPIIFMGAEPFCKKCIPDQIEKRAAQKKKDSKEKGTKEEGKEDQEDDDDFFSKMVEQFSLQNTYQSERSLIQKYLFKLDDFNGDLRYMHDEVDERAQDSKDNLDNLPELMCEIFDTSQKSIMSHKQTFLTEVYDIIQK